MNYPKVQWKGEWGERLSNIFAENLRDLYAKYDAGEGEYPKGFLHTSSCAHEGTCYYTQMWARDCARGIIELAELGFVQEAQSVLDYLLQHINFGDYWGREIHMTGETLNAELDGNALILLAFGVVYRCTRQNGKRYLQALDKVLRHFIEAIETDAGMLLSKSELSGNPDTDYAVYGLFGNYAMWVALQSIAEMAAAEGVQIAGLSSAISRLQSNLQGKFVSDGVHARAEKGTYVNAICPKTGRPYETVEFAGVSVDASCWTRQIPCIVEIDRLGAQGVPLETLQSCCKPYADIVLRPMRFWENWEKTVEQVREICQNKNPSAADVLSYLALRNAMAESAWFRLYGFVSNTAFKGMGGRHDDTMCGYGQGFFTQASLYFRDVNAYGKCLEGIARLGYDGNVLQHETAEYNPFVMHECFDFENYLTGKDHTFGALSNGRANVMDNPGDEGNLVQAAEVIKALRMSIGLGVEGDTLVVAPKLTWLMHGLTVENYPVYRQGVQHRIDVDYTIQRWAGRCNVRIRGAQAFEKVCCVLGPFPLQHADRNAISVWDAKWVVCSATREQEDFVCEYNY